MTRFFIAAVLLILAAYGLLKAWPLLAGPTLSVASPQEGASFPGGIVPVSGMATRIALLTLDGAPMLHDENGSFSSIRTFPHGESILTFVAADQFGRQVTVTRTLFVPN